MAHMNADYGFTLCILLRQYTRLLPHETLWEERQSSSCMTKVTQA